MARRPAWHAGTVDDQPALRLSARRTEPRGTAFVAIKLWRRSDCSMMFRTGSCEFAASSSPKYMRVARPILMPREASQNLT